MVRAPLFVLALLLVFGATFLLADRLCFAPVKDEIHFLESARIFAAPFGLEQLRSYPEVVTPLALVVWGSLERLTGEGLWAGRFLNLLCSFALALMVGFARPPLSVRSMLATVGMLAFPYTLPLSVHLYTDVIAAALAGAATVAVLQRRPALAFVSAGAAIATRQYLVQVPAALAASESLAWLGGSPGRWKTALACAAAVATLVIWVAFFGGLAPRAGIEAWVPLYPAPMLEASAFVLHHGLFALTGLGAYFVLLEALLYRELPARDALLRPRALLVAAVLAGLFAVDPPFLTASHPGGPIGRISRLLLPSPDFDRARVCVYYLLALAAAVRFTARLDAAFWIVAAGVVLSMKQQIPWEKYLLPTLSSLWILRAAGELRPYGEGERTESTSNSLTKQSSPISRLST
jgi:hypothetical protein